MSGSERIVRNSANNAGKVSYGQPTSLHPRTAAGYTADGRMFILIVDGRDSSHSLGMTSLEVADLLLSFGVTDAVNLDGGGSTTLAFADPIRTVNKPSDDPERLVGTSLCVFAGDKPYVASGKYIFADFEQGDIQNDGKADYKDFAILAAAWQSSKESPIWNPYCDVSLPRDNNIDINDLAVVVDHWLRQNQ